MTTPRTDDDIWREMSKMHKRGFVHLISKQRPGALGMLDRFFGRPPFSETDVGFVVYFGDIQRMYLRYLHSKIIDATVQVQLDCPLTSGREGALSGAEELGPLLRTYGKSISSVPLGAILTDPKTVQAVQDHDYMTKFAVKATDPFVATSRRHHDRAAFDSSCRRRKLAVEHLVPPASDDEDDEQPDLGDEDLENEWRQRRWMDRLREASVPSGPWEDDHNFRPDQPASTLVNTRTTSAKKAFWTRVGAAAIGAAFLIAPMWILALKRNLYLHLGIATGCIGAFGISMSLYLESVDNVFAATLAYAAVIMVFVGIVTEEIGSQ